jgi:integrase
MSARRITGFVTTDGYQQAAALFSEASGGVTLHQLRHSALTHDAEDGAGTPMLMARSRSHLGQVAGQVRTGERRGAGAAPGRARPNPSPVGQPPQRS